MKLPEATPGADAPGVSKPPDAVLRDSAQGNAGLKPTLHATCQFVVSLYAID
ncbi:hypothetical protein SB861_17165 [Paraburkholderia sp. SIMBA_049]